MNILNQRVPFKTTNVLYFLLAVLFVSVPAGAQDIKTVEMEGTDDLKFSVTEIEAKPGQEIKVILTTVSSFPKVAMAHNFVLLKQEADATKVANTSSRHPDNEYIAPQLTDRIIAYSGMAGKGETVEVTFTAPDQPGEYQYICTFPGHYAAGMKGTLVVK